MDRERQTFELLQLLGDDVAEAVLSRLEPDRAALLRTGMQSDKTRRSTIGRQRAVLDEFDCFFQFALKALPRESAEALELPETSVSVELNLNNQMLNEVANAETKSEAESVDAVSDKDTNIEMSAVDKSSETPEKPIPAPPALTGIPLLDLQTLSVHQIASALTSEQPKTCAILLSNLPANLRGTF